MHDPYILCVIERENLQGTSQFLKLSLGSCRSSNALSDWPLEALL